MTRARLDASVRDHFIQELTMTMPRNIKKPTVFHQVEIKLAYLAAFHAIGFDPGPSMAEELASLTTDVGDLMDAVKAMRQAPELGRVSAALTLLRDRKRDREREAVSAR